MAHSSPTVLSIRLAHSPTVVLFMKLARQHRVSLIGGDTCSSPHGIFLDVTIIGDNHSSVYPAYIGETAALIRKTLQAVQPEAIL